jgi:hypothetical protein
MQSSAPGTSTKACSGSRCRQNPLCRGRARGAAIRLGVRAIGYSQEHILHRFTLRLLAWREDFGNESLWAAELGRRVAQHGADELWPLIAAR